SSRILHTRSKRDWSSDVCSSDLCSSRGAALIRRFGVASKHGLHPRRCIDPPSEAGIDPFRSLDNSAVLGGDVHAEQWLMVGDPVTQVADPLQFEVQSAALTPLEGVP